MSLLIQVIKNLHEPVPCSWGQHKLEFPFQDSAGRGRDSVRITFGRLNVQDSRDYYNGLTGGLDVENGSPIIGGMELSTERMTGT